MGQRQRGKSGLMAGVLAVLLLGVVAGTAAPPSSYSAHELWWSELRPEEVLQRLQQLRPNLPEWTGGFPLRPPSIERPPDWMPLHPELPLPEFPLVPPPGSSPVERPPVVVQPGVPSVSPPGSTPVEPSEWWPPDLPIEPPVDPPEDPPQLLKPQPGSSPVGRTPPESEGRRWLKTLEGFWEQYIGPLEQTPEARKLLAYLVNGVEGLSLELPDGSGGRQKLWDILPSGQATGISAGTGDSGALSWVRDWDWISLQQLDFALQSAILSFGRKESAEGSRWGWGQGLRELLPGYGVNLRRNPLIDDVLLPACGVLLLTLVLWGVVLAWRRYCFKGSGVAATTAAVLPTGGSPLAGSLQIREELIRAFEHLSMRLLGQQVRFQTHRAIAAALQERRMVGTGDIELLSRVYEWARYMPEQELLPAETIETARQVLARWVREAGA